MVERNGELLAVALAPDPEPAEAPPKELASGVVVPDFDQIYREHFPFVWRTARRLGVESGALDDICQEVFVVVHRRLPQFEGRSSIRTWVFSILANVVRTHRRTQTRKRVKDRQDGVEPDQISAESGNPDEAARRAQMAEVAQRLLEQMDEDKRSVFVLVELEEMSVKEIAEGLNLNVNTVHARLRAARMRFAELAARHRAQDTRRLSWTS